MIHTATNSKKMVTIKIDLKAWETIARYQEELLLKGREKVSYSEAIELMDMKIKRRT